MESEYFFYLFLVIGAVPVLIAGIVGGQKAVFYTGLGSFLLTCGGDSFCSSSSTSIPRDFGAYDDAVRDIWLASRKKYLQPTSTNSEGLNVE